MKNKITETNTVVKESSIEAFRILSMLLVLIVHSNFWFLGEPNLLDGISAKEYLRILLESMSSICVNCFIIISGYFGIKPKIKSILNLFTQIFFVYILCYSVNCFFGGEEFKWKSFLSVFFAFSRENWFVQSYLMLILFSPILNSFIEKVSNKYALKYIVIFFFCAFWFGCVRNCEYSSFNKGFSVIHFIMLYLLARLVKNNKDCIDRVDRKIWLIMYFVCTLIVSFLYIVGFNFSYYYCNPFIVLSAFSLFFFFLSFKYYNRIINWIAVSSFAVFLIHTTNPVLKFFKDFTIYASSNFGCYKFSLYMGVVIFVIFFGSIFVDKVRIFLFKKIITIIDFKISTKYEKIF